VVHAVEDMRGEGETTGKEEGGTVNAADTLEKNNQLRKYERRPEKGQERGWEWRRRHRSGKYQRMGPLQE